jgi:hypothetical protein
VRIIFVELSHCTILSIGIELKLLTKNLKIEQRTQHSAIAKRIGRILFIYKLYCTLRNNILMLPVF